MYKQIKTVHTMQVAYQLTDLQTVHISVKNRPT